MWIRGKKCPEACITVSKPKSLTHFCWLQLWDWELTFKYEGEEILICKGDTGVGHCSELRVAGDGKSLQLVVYIRHSGIQVSQKIKIVTKKAEILAYCQTELLQNLVQGTFILLSFILWFKKQMVTLKSTKKPLTFSDTEYESYHMGFLWFSSVVATWMEFVNYRNDSLQFCTICLAHGLKYYGKCLDVRLFPKAWKGREQSRMHHENPSWVLQSIHALIGITIMISHIDFWWITTILFRPLHSCTSSHATVKYYSLKNKAVNESSACFVELAAK